MQNNFYVRLADEMQLFDDKNDARSLYAAASKIYGSTKCSNEGVGLLQLDGFSRAITGDEINKRWLQHCQLLFNQSSIGSDNINDYLGNPKKINVELAKPFIMKDLLRAIKAMKYHKAPGNDGMPIEVYCFIESECLLDVLLVCFNDALRTGLVDKGLKDVIITTLFKKGSPMICDNYRTLSLINHIGKVLEKMIQFRLGMYCESIGCLPESQNGFRSDRSTVDAMFVSRLLATSAREKNVSVFKCFIDLTKAYDRVNRDILWKVLGNKGVPDALIDLIKGLLVGSAAAIRIKGEIVADFSLDMGLKQGSVFSPLLFNIFFGSIIDAWQAKLGERGIPLIFNLKGNFLSIDALKMRANIERMSLTDLLFADDAEIVAS